MSVAFFLLVLLLGIAPVPALSAEEGVADALPLAREAQAAYRAGRYGDAASLFDRAASLAGADRPSLSAACTYNAGLARLRAGDPSAALPALRSLSDAPNAPAAAQEALAAALYEAARATVPTSETDTAALRSKIALLEESAAAYQSAINATRNPPDRLRRNLAAASSDLPRLREEAHRAEVLQKYGQTPPQQLAADLLRRLRDVRADATHALTNDTPALLARFEDAARRQREVADLWLPLRPELEGAFTSAVTNQEQLVHILDGLQRTGESLTNAVAALEDSDPAGLDALRQCEESALGYFSLMADPRAILAEAIHAQTNAIDSAKAAREARAPADDQGLAVAMTELFAQRFPAWADQLAAQGVPAGPPPDAEGAPADAAPQTLSPEDRAEIERLAAETLEVQRSIVQAGATPDKQLVESSLPDRQYAYANLLKIQDLLPKDQNQQQQQQQQDQQQDQQQEQPQEQDSSEPPEQDDSSETEAQPDQPDPTEEAARAILQRMLDKEKDLQEERRRKRQALPPRPQERDW